MTTAAKFLAVAALCLGIAYGVGVWVDHSLASVQIGGTR